MPEEPPFIFSKMKMKGGSYILSEDSVVKLNLR